MAYIQQLNEIIQLNNCGAFALMTGHYDDGMKVLTKSLQLSRRTVSSTATQDTICSDQWKTSASEPTVSIRLDDFIMMSEATSSANGRAGTPGRTPCHESVYDDDDDDDNEMMGHDRIYSTPIAMDAVDITDDRFRTAWNDTYATVSTVVIFNLALAHQLCAVSKPEPSNDKLRKAVRLYDLALILCRKQDLGDSVMFVMAVLNNLGLAQLRIGQEQAAVETFQQVMSTVVYLQSADCERSVCSRFLWNAMKGIGGQSIAAAAAA